MSFLAVVARTLHSKAPWREFDVAMVLRLRFPLFTALVRRKRVGDLHRMLGRGRSNNLFGGRRVEAVSVLVVQSKAAGTVAYFKRIS